MTKLIVAFRNLGHAPKNEIDDSREKLRCFRWRAQVSKKYVFLRSCAVLPIVSRQKPTADLLTPQYHKKKGVGHIA
jgi:hypothetical protein